MNHLPHSEPIAGPKIIIAEDDVLLRLTISDLLRQRGFEVFEAADADEAISILRCTANIDLVATDMDMRAPDDGVDAPKEVVPANVPMHAANVG